jgi:hypothetical protein
LDGRAQAGVELSANHATLFAEAKICIQLAQRNRTAVEVVNVRPSGVILAIVVLGGGLFASAQVDEGARQGFPLVPGTEWVYRGLVRSSEEGSTVGKVTGVTWKMSVVRTVEREGVLAAIVSGFPGDLNWSDGHAEPQRSLLLRTEDAKFYLKSEWVTQSALDQLDNPKYPLRELIDPDDWIFQMPLAAGKRFCDEQAMKREDGEYCWVTGSPHPVDLRAVKGLTPGTRTAYEVTYATNPDDTEFEFVGGVGITSYQYHHHGTIAETELRLIEFHPASGSSR